MTTNDNINSDGGFTASSSSLNYMVALNGRVTMTGSSSPPVLYLFGQNNGFLVGTDPLLPVFGTIEPQAAGPFNNASLSGRYMFGAEDPFFLPGSPEAGVVSLDGAGNAAGTSDISNSEGLTQNQSFSLPHFNFNRWHRKL